MEKLYTVAAGVVLALALGCTTSCPPCRGLTVQADEGLPGTLPYTLEIDGDVRCDVVSSVGQPERLRCYCLDPMVR